MSDGESGKPQQNIFFSGDKSVTFQLLVSDSQFLSDDETQVRGDHCIGFTSCAIFLGLKLSKSSIAFSVVVVNVKPDVLMYTCVLMGKAY